MVYQVHVVNNLLPLHVTFKNANWIFYLYYLYAWMLQYVIVLLSSIIACPGGEGGALPYL